MINFRFSSAYLILTELTILIRVSNHNMEFVTTLGRNQAFAVDSAKASEALADCRRGADWVAGSAKNIFAQLQCSHINAAADRLASWAKDNNKEWSELNTTSRALRDAIDTELEEYHYFQYPKDKAKALLSWREHWDVVLSAFSIEREIFSAVDCFALGHNTASVFHCMRILENGLGAIAVSVGLNFDTQQWNTIIEQIEAKISELRKTLPHGVEKNERMQFLSEAAKEFFYFKDGWRNYVSHNRGEYDEHQARSTLEHVRTFMSVLAKGL